MAKTLKILGLLLIHLIAVFALLYCASHLFWVVHDFKNEEGNRFATHITFITYPYALGLFVSLKILFSIKYTNV